MIKNNLRSPRLPSPVQRGGPTKLRDGTPTLRFRHILGPQSIENARQGKYFAFFIISLLKFVFTFLSFYNILQQQGKIILILKWTTPWTLNVNFHIFFLFWCRGIWQSSKKLSYTLTSIEYHISKNLWIPPILLYSALCLSRPQANRWIFVSRKHAGINWFEGCISSM